MATLNVHTTSHTTQDALLIDTRETRDVPCRLNAFLDRLRSKYSYTRVEITNEHRATGCERTFTYVGVDQQGTAYCGAFTSSRRHRLLYEDDLNTVSGCKQGQRTATVSRATLPTYRFRSASLRTARIQAAHLLPKTTRHVGA